MLGCRIRVELRCKIALATTHLSVCFDKLALSYCKAALGFVARKIFLGVGRGSVKLDAELGCRSHLAIIPSPVLMMVEAFEATSFYIALAILLSLDNRNIASVGVSIFLYYIALPHFTCGSVILLLRIR